MTASFRRAVVGAVLAASSAFASAQVPDGYIVWGSFQGTAGVHGIYFSHPRDGLQPAIAVTNLPAALAYDPAGRRGAASLLLRPSDGALLVGERSPAGTSVDVHLLRLQGANVVFAQLFSVGTSANVGEIPQLALLPDGRIVVAATDLAAGSPLARFQTLQYNWEGVGILDPISGGVVPIAISNLNQFPGVINGLAVSPDGGTVYLGNYISTTSGDLWSVPIGGGAATQMATLPAGASNVAVDLDGSVLVATLNGPPNLFRVDPVTHAVTAIATTSGPLNAICIETVTGNYVLATANAGIPARSLVWMTPGGAETVLQSPNRATIAAVDVEPNPGSYAGGTAGASTYSWRLRPNPGGLPLAGSGGFSLTVASSQPMQALSLLVLSTGRVQPPVQRFGLDIAVDLNSAVTAFANFSDQTTFALPIPNLPELVGMPLFAQSLFYEILTDTLAASPGVEFTIL